MKQVCRIKPPRDIKLNLTCEKGKEYIYNDSGIGHLKTKIY